MRTANPPAFRFLVDETVGEFFLKPRIAAFLISHPSLSIDILQHAWPSGRADADLVLQYAPMSSHPVDAVVLGQQRLLTCATPQYLRERGLPHHPRDLSQHRHDSIVVPAETKIWSAWEFASGSETLSVESGTRATVPSLSMALALTLSGAGVSQIPECWGIGHVRSGRLVRLLPEWEASLNLVAFEPHGQGNPNAQELLCFVRALVDMGAPGRPC